MHIGHRIVQLRYNAKLSINELADRAGVHASTIMRLESATALSPGLDVVTKLARALGVSVSELIGEQAVDESAHKEIELLRSKLAKVTRMHIELFISYATLLDEYAPYWREHASKEIKELKKQLESFAATT